MLMNATTIGHIIIIIITSPPALTGEATAALGLASDDDSLVRDLNATTRMRMNPTMIKRFPIRAV